MRYAQVSWSLNFSVWRVAAYYVQRGVTWPLPRAAALGLLRRAVGGAADALPSTWPGIESALATLRADGIAPLGQLLGAQECADITDFLRDKPLTHRSHRGGAFTLASRPPDLRLGDHALADLVQCPHILRLANSPALLDLARRYIGCTPTISGLSARWSFPGESSTETVQQFHRDSEDWKAFRVMVYLTDVDDTSGPHVYIRRTHGDRHTSRLKVVRSREIEQQFGPQRIVRQLGTRGTGFAVDTAGLHKGEVPRTAARLLLSFQYSILPCYLYEYEPIGVSGVAVDPYINRLVVYQIRN